MSLPIPIITENFEKFYKEQHKKEKVYIRPLRPRSSLEICGVGLRDPSVRYLPLNFYLSNTKEDIVGFLSVKKG